MHFTKEIIYISSLHAFLNRQVSKERYSAFNIWENNWSSAHLVFNSCTWLLKFIGFCSFHELSPLFCQFATITNRLLTRSRFHYFA